MIKQTAQCDLTHCFCLQQNTMTAGISEGIIPITSTGREKLKVSMHAVLRLFSEREFTAVQNLCRTFPARLNLRSEVNETHQLSIKLPLMLHTSLKITFYHGNNNHTLEELSDQNNQGHRESNVLTKAVITETHSGHNID